VFSVENSFRCLASEFMTMKGLVHFEFRAGNDRPGIVLSK
jgi:hypothetical protein